LLVVSRRGWPTSNPRAGVAGHACGSQEAQKLIAEKKVVVLDLRTPGEFNSGRLPGATNIDFLASDFSQRLNALDKSKAYLVHCASGGRSTQSLKMFQTQQFQSVYHLDGGIKAWKKTGLPLESNGK
jgi:rhodanese-related sulfurtransferase